MTEASVSKKCRSLLSRYHPDKNVDRQELAQAVFVHIQWAKDQLVSALGSPELMTELVHGHCQREDDFLRDNVARSTDVVALGVTHL